MQDEILGIGELPQELDDLHEVDLAEVRVGRRVNQMLERDHERVLDAHLIGGAHERELRQEIRKHRTKTHVAFGQRTKVHDEQLGEELGRQDVTGHVELAQAFDGAGAHVRVVVVEQCG